MTVDALIGILHKMPLDAEVINDLFMDIEPEEIRVIEFNGREVVQIGN